MKQKRNVYAIAVLIWLMVLIFDSSRAFAGAAAGLELCIRTVIPSLFPFFVCSMYLTERVSCRDFGLLFRLAAGLKIPEAASSVLIPAFLGGYPVGAKCIGDLYGSSRICRKDAQRLLSFCCNAGPSFLFGMVSGFFPDLKMVWMLWLIHIAGAVLTSFVFTGSCSDQDLPNTETADGEREDIMVSAVKAMGIVCGWVILFRMIIGFLQTWFLWACPQWMQVLIMGFLELSNGCCQLMTVGDVSIRFVLCSTMLAFGGVCVFLQTASVIKDLSVRSYIAGKMVQTLFCFLLSCAAAVRNGWIFGIIIPLIFVVLRKSKNKYGNPAAHPV